jgi:hypothetical protein
MAHAPPHPGGRQPSTNTADSEGATRRHLGTETTSGSHGSPLVWADLPPDLLAFARALNLVLAVSGAGPLRYDT